MKKTAIAMILAEVTLVAVFQAPSLHASADLCSTVFSGAPGQEKIEFPRTPEEDAGLREWLQKYGVGSDHSSNRSPLLPVLEGRLKKYDKEAWREALRDQADGAPADRWEVRQGMAEMIANMPAALKSDLMRYVDSIYPNARESRVDSGRLAKRNLDFFISSAISPRSVIEHQVDGGSTAVRAYQDYLDTEANALPDVAPAKYGSNEVLAVAKYLKSQFELIRSHAIVRPGEEFNLVLMGSFPNGRADLKSSDLDLLLPSVNLDTETYEALNRGVKQTLKQAGQNQSELRISQVDYLTYFEVRVAVTPSSGPLKTYAQLSPIAVQINQSGVELWVFDPLNREREPLILSIP